MNSPVAGERGARHHPRRVAGDQREADERHQRDRRDQQAQPEKVGDQRAALGRLAQRQVAAAGDVQPGVRDAPGDRHERHHRHVAPRFRHAEVAQQQRRGGDAQEDARRRCRPPARAAADDPAAGLGRAQDVVGGRRAHGPGGATTPAVQDRSAQDALSAQAPDRPAQEPRRLALGARVRDADARVRGLVSATFHEPRLAVSRAAGILPSQRRPRPAS